MDIKQKYREEFNRDVYSEDCCMQPTASYNDEYVKWLERQINNNFAPDIAAMAAASRFDYTKPIKKPKLSSPIYVSEITSDGDDTLHLTLKGANDFRNSELREYIEEVLNNNQPENES